MTAQPFIRTAMLPPQSPPVTERGAIKWLRENLFSSWLNAILTVLAALALWQFIALSLPWLLHGVWTADSLGQCRDIIAQNFGPDAGGACWAVIHARWHQFIFGFYPPDLWYRPILTFGLMLVALVPVIYSNDARNALRLLGPVAILTLIAMLAVGTPIWIYALSGLMLAGCVWVGASRPLRLLPVTALYPFFAVWMLWGGSIWGVVVALLGFVVLTVVYRLLNRVIGVALATSAGVVAAGLWWIVLDSHVADILQSLAPITIPAVESDKFGGFLLAFLIGVSSISISLPIGILLALGRQSNMPLIHGISVGFIEFVRGVPLITMLFTASLLLQYFLPPQVQFDLILRVVILVTLFSAAYNAEVIRGGLAALPKGQYEAADALGLDYWQAQRLIIMPQALKVSIPGIVNTFIGLFKDTTLVSFVGLMDPLRGVTNIVRADIYWKGIYWEPYIFVGAIFFAACYGMSRYALYLERKLKTDHR
jgi:general L-amino acid transport system permease protein